MPGAMSTLLVELPFRSIEQPNIGLSLIRQGLLRSGHYCSILYANLEFAVTVGEELYKTIGEYLPQEFLAGEVIFAPDVWGCPVTVDDLKYIPSGRTENRATSVPAGILRKIPELQAIAHEFVNALAGEIAELDVAIVGFSTTFFRLPSIAVARALKERRPDVIVVLGGANCEGEMGVATLQSFPSIDFVLRGEAEYTMAQLVTTLRDDQRNFESIEGLVWRQEQNIRASSNETVNSNLDSLPMPDYWDWFEQRAEHGFDKRTMQVSLPLETSRGCWFGEKSHCIFCGLNGESLASRQKSPQRVLLELDDLQRYGIDHLFATDLIFPHTYFGTLLPELAKREYRYSIYYEVKSNLSRTQLAQMRAAGIVQLQPGIESLDTNTLKLMRKGVAGYQNVRLLKWCAELGVNAFWNILIGTPGEPPESLRRCIDLISKIVHLRPPVDGCVKIRVDRFSPMFNEPGRFGFSDLQPSVGYATAYKLPKQELRSLAYYFVPDDQMTNDDYHRATLELARAVNEWHACIGRASLVLLKHRDGVYVCDRRAGACEPIELSENQAAVLRMSEPGVPEHRLRSALGRAVADHAIESLLERDLVCELDGLLLSLPTNYDIETIAPGLPVEESLSIAHVLHCTRMRNFCAPYQVNLETRSS
jgi:magnesium-protoporphyrin IX monomethyl ester (oxidative) cyclase